MPVSFSYSGASVLAKKVSKPLMNELPWTTVIALGPAVARRGPRAAAAPPASAVVRNSRRVVMESPSRSRLGTGEGPARYVGGSDRDRIREASGPPPTQPDGSIVCGTLGPAPDPVKATSWTSTGVGRSGGAQPFTDPAVRPAT